MPESEIEWQEFITLEGPFLEQAWAAYCLKTGQNVVPRYETMGTHHDVLIQSFDHSIVDECTGQAMMTEAKIRKLKGDVYELKEKLPKERDTKPLKEVRLVSATRTSDWSAGVQSTFEKTKDELKRKGIELSLVNESDLLLRLISSGVIGLRCIRDRVVFVGPEDWAIRFYDDRKTFAYGSAPLDLQRYRELPHSFFPSHYWEQFYRQLFEEAAKESQEFPLSWTHHHNFGIKWQNLSDLKEAVKRATLSQGPSSTIADGAGGFVQVSYTRKHSYYAVNVFHAGEQMTKDDVNERKGYATELIEDVRKSRDYIESRPFFVKLYSSTEAWSPLAWAAGRRVYEGEDISHFGAKKGDDVLLRCLNSGVLGFKWRVNNEITLSTGESSRSLKLMNGILSWQEGEKAL